MGKSVVIEIGAFDGEDTEKYVNRNSFVYCFEPDLECYKNLKQRFYNNQNIEIFNKAIGTYNGMGKFYVSKNKMSSSINKPSQYSIDNKIIENIDVVDIEIIRLDTFMNQKEIESVDYLHCDAQGSDLDILKSLNDKISIIKRGQVEGSRIKNLYQTQNIYTDIIDYLESNNFIILNKDEIEERINWKDLNILFVNKQHQSLI